MNFKLILGVLMISVALTAAQAVCAANGADCATCLASGPNCVYSFEDGDAYCSDTGGNKCSSIFTCYSGYECKDSVTTCGADFCDTACSDDVLNQDETATDCGGVCGATCGTGDACNTGADCISNNCDGVCIAGPPANDLLANAITINAGPTVFDTTAATNDGPETQINVHNNIWYKYTPAESGTLTVDTCGSALDTSVVIFEGCVGVGWNDQLVWGSSSDECGDDVYVQTAVTAGTCYLIDVGSGIFGVTGTGTLALEFGETPPTECPAGFGCDIGALCFTDETCDSYNCDSAGRCAASDNGGYGRLSYDDNFDTNTYNFWRGGEPSSAIYPREDNYFGSADGDYYAVIHGDGLGGANPGDFVNALWDVSSLGVETQTVQSDRFLIFDGTLYSGQSSTMTKDLIIPVLPGTLEIRCYSGSVGLEDLTETGGVITTSTVIIEGVTYGICPNIAGSAIASFGNANLTIFDEYESSSIIAGNDSDFFAFYYNESDDTDTITPGDGGGCWIEFDDAWGTLIAMDWNGTHYNYTKVGGFASGGTRNWNVTCNDSNAVYAAITDLQDDIEIIGGVPEFSDVAWVLAAVLGAGGFFLIRRKKSF
ncbi:MAG: hypothetical protein PHC66_03985 [Candidatus Nanoarchaeia archaeon]|nr:hypothetical protein [Candidatus Nanoarchaeia archaeon]MDD5239343.1 hypothetical protein [Candidatus Nanoarchaeia archaeon]